MVSLACQGRRQNIPVGRCAAGIPRFCLYWGVFRRRLLRSGPVRLRPMGLGTCACLTLRFCWTAGGAVRRFAVRRLGRPAALCRLGCRCLRPRRLLLGRGGRCRVAVAGAGCAQAGEDHCQEHERCCGCGDSCLLFSFVLAVHVSGLPFFMSRFWRFPAALSALFFSFPGFRSAGTVRRLRGRGRSEAVLERSAPWLFYPA